MKTTTSLLLLILLFFGSPGLSQSNLVGYWSFDNTQKNTIFDGSSYANHGINYGAKLIDGRKGKALEFDGKDDYVRIYGEFKNTPGVLNDLGKGSISLWFRVDSIPTKYGIAPLFYYGAEEKCDFFDAANKGLIIEIGHSPVHLGSENIYFTIWKNGCTYPSFCFDSGEPISTGEWHHFVAVVGADYNTGYLDGQEITQRRYNFGDNTYSQFFEDALAHEKMWLGKGHWDRTTQHFNGAIDEVKIYNKPLSKLEVASLYSSNGDGTVTGWPGKTSSTKIKIYPNPVFHRLNYDLTDLKEEISQIEITNMTGNVVVQYTLNEKKQSLSVEKLEPGTYLVDFIGPTSRFREKIVVVHP